MAKWQRSFLFLFFFFFLVSGAAGETLSLTAREAVRLALANNPDTSIALARLEAAQAALDLERAALSPRLSLESRYGQTDNPMYSFGNILNQGAFEPGIDFNDPGRTDGLNLGVKLAYRLYDGGRRESSIAAAEARGEATFFDSSSLRSQLGFEAVRAFHHVVQADGLAAAQRAGLEALDAAIAVAEARYGEGLLLKSDLLDLEVQRITAREGLVQAENRAALSRRVLQNLLGLDAEEAEINWRSTTDPQAVPPASTPAQRPELESLEAMIRSAQHTVRSAESGQRPELDTYAGYGWDMGSVTGGAGDSWEAGLLLRYNLFDGHRTKAEVARAAAGRAELREQQRKLRLAVDLDIRRAALNLEEAESRLRVSAETVTLAEESARINRARFAEGLVLAADLIGVESRLTEARLRRAVTETSRRVAVADLRRALGLPQFPDLADGSDSSNGSNGSNGLNASKE